VSQHLAAETKRVLCDTCKVRVVYNFVDTERYAPRPCGTTRARFAKPDEKLLLHVSNFRPVKRTLDVIAIFAEVAQRMPARLLLVGEGPELQRAEEFAAGLGLANRVRALGQRSDIERILPCVDLFLLPSQSESFGLAALEAMACGVPPLASRVGGLPEVIEDGVSGILAPVGAVGEMAARAIELLGNPAAHAAMAEAARQRAKDRFDRSLWIGEYESVYRQLLAGA
jgi:N-acetyl-alpha-D-glucosaminyl L-malate synthase BshA